LVHKVDIALLKFLNT